MISPETIARIEALMAEASVFEDDLEESFILGGGPGGQGGHRGGGGVDKSSDTELQAMITEVAPKFELRTFEDEVLHGKHPHLLY